MLCLGAPARNMNLNEILSALWHRKLIVVGIMVLTVAAAVGGLTLVNPEYKSTSTLALTPPNTGNGLLFFQTLDPVVSVYATAAETRSIRTAAAARLNGKLAHISVRTFRATPIIKIDARSTSPLLAQRSAQVVGDVLLERAARGAVGISSLTLQQIDRPSVPTSPVFPNKKLTVFVAILLGLGLGIAAALLRENLGRRIWTREELAAAAGVPVYAEIPDVSELQKEVSLERLVTKPEYRTVSEALRDLRTNLEFSEGAVGSILVTSPEGRHGKTTVAVGLAATLARTGTRTILVDADIRRPRVADMLVMERAPGLTEALTGADLSAVIRTTTLPELDILTSGGIVSDPGQVLTTSFSPMLKRLEQMYDAVVIDTTPLVPVNDARVIAGLVRTVLIVARSEKASQQCVREAVDRLSLISIKPTAAILNRSHSRQARGYYGLPDEAQQRDNGATSRPRRETESRRTRTQ